MLDLTRRQILAATLALGTSPLIAAAPRAAETLVLKGPHGRSISASEWRPKTRPRGLILFSHGAASSPRYYEAIILPWVEAGYRVLAPLHVDSLEHPDTARFPGLASWKARIEDMRALSAYVGRRPWIAAGHSYGGLVALTLGGAEAVPPQGISGSLADPQVRAVIAFSPPAPIPALITQQGYATLKVPALIQTGTADLVPGMTGTEGWTGHLAPFHAAAMNGQRYALVLEGVDHYFGGAICRFDRPGPRQTERLADANRIATLFLKGFAEQSQRNRKLLDAQLTDAGPVRLMRR